MFGAPREFRGCIYDNILDTIGARPIVRLSRLMAPASVEAKFLPKLKFFKHIESVKDRIGLEIVEALERDGKIGPDRMVAEFTFGNSGIALNCVCAVKGYRLISTVPAFMSAERRKMLLLRGATIHLTPALEGMLGDIARADGIFAELSDAVIPQQFTNSANPSFHRRTTAKEIWRYTDGNLNVKIASVGTGGTGGTSTGCTGFLKNTTLVLG